MLDALRQELQEPQTTLGKRYTVLLIITIIASIFFLFIVDQYPNSFPLGSLQLLLIEVIILVVVGIDFILRLSVTDPRDWRKSLNAFLFEGYPYVDMKIRTDELLDEIREAIKTRPSLDVPFHTGLVQHMSAFLSKTQIEFHPAFYHWMNRIANIYFVLMMLAAPGITGVVVQLLVIYVFKGMIVVIDDMDHAVDLEVTIFNSMILDI